MSTLSAARRRPLPDARWVEPVQGAGISTPYGKRGSAWSSGAHTGSDFAAAEGRPVRAVMAGRVTSVGDAGAYGLRVVVVHRPGFETWYCHLSKISTSSGAQVAAGGVLGLVGQTGNTTGPHLHLEVRVNGVHRDPAPYLSGAVDAPASPTYDTGAQPAGQVTNAAVVPSGIGDEMRRLALVGAVVVGGVLLVAVGFAQGTSPTPKKAS